MLCFLIPLKARAVSSDWNGVCRVFEQTLRSVCAQGHPDFRVLVVCHDRPTLRDSAISDKVEFLSVSFAPPDHRVPATTMSDKFRKLAVGLMHARKLAPSFTMFVDADDLVSNRLTGHVHTHPQANGWTLSQGFVFNQSQRQMRRQDDFEKSCGTSAILNTRLYKFPDDDDPLDPGFLERAREQCLPLRQGHSVIADFLARQNTPLEPLPFPGAIYVISHGDNDSAFQLNLQNEKAPSAPSVSAQGALRPLQSSLQKLKQARRNLLDKRHEVPLTTAVQQEFNLIL